MIRRIHPLGAEGLRGLAAERRARRLPDGEPEGDAGDGSFHNVDSDQLSFEVAAKAAFRHALPRVQARPAGAHREDRW